MRFIAKSKLVCSVLGNGRVMFTNLHLVVMTTSNRLAMR